MEKTQKNSTVKKFAGKIHCKKKKSNIVRLLALI